MEHHSCVWLESKISRIPPPRADQSRLKFNGAQLPAHRQVHPQIQPNSYLKHQHCWRSGYWQRVVCFPLSSKKYSIETAVNVVTTKLTIDWNQPCFLCLWCQITWASNKLRLKLFDNISNINLIPHRSKINYQNWLDLYNLTISLWYKPPTRSTALGFALFQQRCSRWSWARYTTWVY